MARPGVDITMIGDKALERALKRLPDVAQKRAVRPAIRKSSKRVQKRVVAKLPVLTGDLKRAVAAAKTRSAGKRGVIRVGFQRPADKRIAIKLNVNEYGSASRGIAPRRTIRNTIDANAASEQRQIGRDIGLGIEKQWKRLNR